MFLLSRDIEAGNNLYSFGSVIPPLSPFFKGGILVSSLAKLFRLCFKAYQVVTALIAFNIPCSIEVGVGGHPCI